jgi:UDP-glucose 4-epimerase
MRILVTGGAGFIGSHLVSSLTRDGHAVTVLDNLSSSRTLANAASFGASVALNKCDILDDAKLEEAIDGHETVYHLAAFTDTTASNTDRAADLRHGTIAMQRLLEAMDHVGVRDLVFPSSQLVFGAPGAKPHGEEVGPLLPVTLYGASKLACEGLVSVYAASFGFRATILRLANIVGPRQRGGILVDFVRKLSETPGRLEILGDGRQTRSYLAVGDCVDAMRHAHALSQPGHASMYHVSNDDAISARQIARIVAGVAAPGQHVELITEDRGEGWSGDVPVLQLDNAKLKATGWRPKASSAEAVRLAVEWLWSERPATEQHPR